MEMTIEVKGTNKQGKPVSRLYTITEKGRKFALKHHIGCIGEGGLSGNLGEYESFDDALQAVSCKVERLGVI